MSDAVANFPELLVGTPEIRCGTCRFRYPQKGPAADAGMGICLRYRGSLPLYTRGHSDACWHHQRAAAVEAAAKGDGDA